MKYPATISALLLVVLAIACDKSGPVASSEKSGMVLVYVHWQEQGLPDKRVELVELGIELATNDEGLAEFVVPIGDYTLRAYEINRGGPVLHFIDQKITVILNDEIRVDVVDCLPCV
jgi:hypothetical protein